MISLSLSLFSYFAVCLFVCLHKVLGYLIRHELDTKNLIKEIKGIASHPTEKYFFNVSSEAALLEEAGTLGERIFSIEGKILNVFEKIDHILPAGKLMILFSFSLVQYCENEG